MRIIISLCLILGMSCSNSKSKLELHQKTERYVNNNFSSYEHIHNKAEKWLNDSRLAKQENVKSIVFDPNYKLDKLLIINSQRNRLVGIVKISDSINNNNTSDWIFKILGMKLSGEWRFFRGGSLHVPREYYKYNIYEPLNQFQLSVIGRDYFLKRFLIVEDEISVNSEVLNNEFSMEINHKYNSTDSLKNWIDYIVDQNNKIITDKEYNEILASINNEVQMESPLPKKGTKKWRDLYGTKPPLFEREEWKNLHKK